MKLFFNGKVRVQNVLFVGKRKSLKRFNKINVFTTLRL